METVFVESAAILDQPQPMLRTENPLGLRVG